MTPAELRAAVAHAICAAAKDHDEDFRLYYPEADAAIRTVIDAAVKVCLGQLDPTPIRSVMDFAIANKNAGVHCCADAIASLRLRPTDTDATNEKGRE